MLVKSIFDDLAVTPDFPRNDADLMELHLAIVDEPENLFGCRGDFIMDAEVGSASVSEIGIFSFSAVIKKPRISGQCALSFWLLSVLCAST